MSTYYTLLDITPQASQAEIEAAYQRQRERYDPSLVAELDPELRRVAAERTAELARGWQILSDPERRRQYDVSIGAAAVEPVRSNRRQQLTTRERLLATAGALVAVALVATIWLLTGRDGGYNGQAMPETNRPAPDFALATLSGGELKLDDYRGQVVLLNFWGTWCEPCKREMPALQSAYEQFGGQGLAVIGVNLTDDERVQGGDEAKIRLFLEQFGVTYPTVLDTEGAVTNAYRVFPLPTSFFIDPEGRIRYVHVGELTLNDVSARFAELKQEAAALSAK